MALDPSFLDELRHRISLTSLIGRRNKLVRSGRNWKTCCPFHGERTPSFHIYDDHFHCFGCGAHGDAISFVMQTDGSSFLEAVERLAGEAGMDMPKGDPQAEQRAKEVQSLADVLAVVQKRYRQKLYQPEGQAGLAYLQGRGLNEETLERFGLGWSGDGRSLTGELQREGVSIEQCMQAGLMRVDGHGQLRGELFFNRVTFPIRDRKGRIVSFGGRILGAGQPKYLNGPETALFSKRRHLFNLDLAGSAVRQGAELIVVEGYLDVISLDQAGLCGAVAPLGTALGEEQLGLLWRLSSSPIICLDGDAAGQRAALRVCEVALPLLSSEKTLRFCRLDDGDDPDTLVNREGAAGMGARLKMARPMVEEVFGLLTAGEHQPGPERRAALRKRLTDLAAQIPDKTLGSEYRSTLLDLFFSRFRPGRKIFGKQTLYGRGDGHIAEPRSVTEGSMERLRVLTALLLHYPSLLVEVEQAYSQLSLPEDLDQIRVFFLEWAGQAEHLEAKACRLWMVRHGQEALYQQIMNVPLTRAVCSVEEGEAFVLDQAMEKWWHYYGLVNFSAFEQEVQRAVQEAIMNAYAAPLSESREAAPFPGAVVAKMRVLEALKRGEKPELDEEA